MFDTAFYRIPLSCCPQAGAVITGSSLFPTIQGYVNFYQTSHGVLITAQIYGLPDSNEPCAPNIYAFHIHEGDSCTGTAADQFADTGSHYNPHNCTHPAHAGDLPPLLSNHGQAFISFLTDRFTVNEVIGRTIMIHGGTDNFTSQPSGNSGSKIACGRITKGRINSHFPKSVIL